MMKSSGSEGFGWWRRGDGDGGGKAPWALQADDARGKGAGADADLQDSWGAVGAEEALEGLEHAEREREAARDVSVGLGAEDEDERVE
eukprot:1868383-Rhodomonas_salina.1